MNTSANVSRTTPPLFAATTAARRTLATSRDYSEAAGHVVALAGHAVSDTARLLGYSLVGSRGPDLKAIRDASAVLARPMDAREDAHFLDIGIMGCANQLGAQIVGAGAALVGVIVGSLVAIPASLLFGRGIDALAYIAAKSFILGATLASPAVYALEAVRGTLANLAGMVCGLPEVAGRGLGNLLTLTFDTLDPRPMGSVVYARDLIAGAWQDALPG